MQVDAVPHGFRSSFRDWCSEQTAYPHEVAEMALAHTIANRVEAAYRRGDLFQKRRRLMADWATFCASSGERSSNSGSGAQALAWLLAVGTAMPKHPPRLTNIPSSPTFPPFDPNPSTWCEIEQSFGGNLSEDDRDAIGRAATCYLHNMAPHHAATPPAAAEHFLASVSNGISHLRRLGTLSAKPQGEERNRVVLSSRMLLGLEYAMDWADPDQASKSPFLRQLMEVERRIELARQRLDVMGVDGGIEWKRREESDFIDDLRQIWEPRNGRATVRSDRDKQAKATLRVTPFRCRPTMPTRARATP
eukprot:gene32004-42703_t